MYWQIPSIFGGMKITFFSTQPYDQQFFTQNNPTPNFELQFFEAALNAQTANLVQDAIAVCVFVKHFVHFSAPGTDTCFVDYFNKLE
jgi:lactate dehydrogenase-like 2-hydroxyacid dehydrogenase